MSELLKINVNDHLEKKNGLSYLSWAWAWSEVLKIDPGATWEPIEYNGMPVCFLPDQSAMVKIQVTIKGNTKSCVLPVMNPKNQAIKSPDAFAINTAIMRALAKGIAMHGLGLYVYSGEDLPEGETAPPPKQDENLLQAVRECENVQALSKLYKSLSDVDRAAHLEAFTKRKTEIAGAQ